MSYRIAAAEISHETNVFSATPTTFRSFVDSGLKTGDAILTAAGSNSAFGGFIAGAAACDFDLLPLVSVWATPSGIVTAEAVRSLRSLLEQQFAEALRAGPIDGVLLALHGAMVTEVDRDGDAYLLETVREITGGRCPLVATLDLHANISQRMVDVADLLIGYDTYPHVDMAERAYEACRLLRQVVEGTIRPVSVLVKPPMVPTSQRMPTAHDPMRRLIARAHVAEADARVLDVTVAGGFPPADVPEGGFSVLVTTNDEPALAASIAEELAMLAWTHRDEFLGGVSTFDEAALRIASLPAQGATPLVIVDIGDNPWTGGPGDSAELLRFLLAQQVTGAALASITDAESVAICLAAGVGQTVALELGGKTDRLHGLPLRVNGRVRMVSNGRYVNSGPMMAGVPVDLGPTARLDVNGIEVLVTSRAETPIDLNVFRIHGIEPTQQRIIGLKGKGHFRAAFEPIGSEVILVEGPGITGADLSRLPLRHRRRPIWPLDPEVDWAPSSVASGRLLPSAYDDAN